MRVPTGMGYKTAAHYHQVKAQLQEYLHYQNGQPLHSAHGYAREFYPEHRPVRVAHGRNHVGRRVAVHHGYHQQGGAHLSGA